MLAVQSETAMADLDDADELPDEDGPSLSTEGEPDVADSELDDTEDSEELDGLIGTLAAADSGKPADARRRIEDYMESKRAARELYELDSYDFD